MLLSQVQPDKISSPAPSDNFLTKRVFLALHLLGGHLGLSLLLITFIFKRQNVKRNPVVLNFVLTWMLFSISHSMGSYAPSDPAMDFYGEHVPSRLKPYWCYAQSILLNGVPVLTASSTFAFISNLWITIQLPELSKRHTVRIAVALITCSWITFIASTAFALYSGRIAHEWYNPDTESNETYRGNILPAYGPLYCVLWIPIDKNPLRLRLYNFILTAMFHTLSVALELHMIWRLSSKVLSTSPTFTTYKSTMMRLAFLAAYKILSICALWIQINEPAISVFELGTSDDVGWYWLAELIQAGMPLIAFFTLASRKDVLSTWRVLGYSRLNRNVAATSDGEEFELQASRASSSVAGAQEIRYRTESEQFDNENKELLL